MPLDVLLSSLGSLAVVFPDVPGDVSVSGVSCDTRELRSDEIFVALPGDHVDGRSFIPRAVEAGARAIVYEGPLPDSLSVPAVQVTDARRALSRLSAEFWGNPSRELRVVGITGTDGKTTTTFLTSAVLDGAGYSTGFVTTVDTKIGRKQWSNTEHVTTPQAPQLHMHLRQMVDVGVNYAVVESSSHGLKLARLEDVAYDVAVLTNVTSEHLELHGTVEQYRRDKSKLFSMLGRSVDKGIGKIGVINADDPNADLFLRSTSGQTLTYGTARYADIVAENIEIIPRGVSFRVLSAYGNTHVELPMIGVFNVYNALAALSVGVSQGVALEQGAEALRNFGGVPGRMQSVSEGQPFGVIVDYAHTADSLSKVLRTLRAARPARLIVVFGSAGERDASKRAPMGKVAAQLADFSIFTNEDPRGEDPETILSEIAAGAEQAGARESHDYLRIADRRKAINEAFRRGRPNDIILLAGKGHERSIQLAEGEIPWNEVEVARELLREL